MAVIEIEKLSREFTRGDERILALDNISLKIEAGEFVAITGPSGSGKSTLMYILGLLDSQTSGSYTLDGRKTNDLNDNERAELRNKKLGFVFQTFHLLPRSNALRNVAMPLIYSASYDKGYSDEKIESSALDALVQVGLKDRMTHKPNELSGGQRQRVAIARALVNKPKILLADEPTGNLDSKRGTEIIELFKELNKTGVIVILVTHDLQIAGSAKRVIRVLDGKIAEDRYATA